AISGEDLPLSVGDLPCFQWSSGSVGDQTISATYDPDGPGGEAGVVIDFNGPGGTLQPLVKEWNAIDTTRIVSVSGSLTPGPYTVEDVVGDGGIADNEGELANWDTTGTSTNCSRNNNGSVWCGSRTNV